ncbi:uncharacterized protein LOC135684662 [Rhopilema esculentum]|uniref:uncharacterized protein LOC135684662 n=1 Tax=Rhopilema esculentum TaxID=499914 RepID=UPI0031CF08FD
MTDGRHYYTSSLFAHCGTVVYISDPVLIKKVLVNEPTGFTRSPYAKKMCPLFGNGVFTSLGKEHAMQRKSLNPYFSTVNVQEYLPIFVKKTKELAEFWSQKLAQNKNLPFETEIMEKFIHLTLDIISLAAFGYDFDCVSNGHSEESSSFNKIMCGNFNVVRKSLETLIPFLKLIPSKERDEEDKAEKVCWNVLERIIEQKKSEVNPNSSDAPMKKNLLDKMIELSNSGCSSFTSRDLLHHVFTFMIGGHETTSTTLTWMVFLFAKHPEVQEKAKEEVRKVLGNKQDITMSDISELAYLSNCINECMRLYPVGAGFGRLAAKECKLGQYTIPANTCMMISLASLHHNEKYWKNPEDFNPSRFDKAGQALDVIQGCIRLL